MTQATHELYPARGPEAIAPDLCLVPGCNDGSYFVSSFEDLNGEIDLSYPIEIAQTRKPDKLLIATMQIIGLAETDEELLQTKNQIDSLVSKEKYTVSDNTLLNHLKKHVDKHGLITEHIGLATECYKEEFWDDYSSRTGQNTDKLIELYEQTAPYDDCALLKVLSMLKASVSQGRMLIHQETVMDADRIARVLVQSTSN